MALNKSGFDFGDDTNSASMLSHSPSKAKKELERDSKF